MRAWLDGKPENPDTMRLFHRFALLFPLILLAACGGKHSSVSATAITNSNPATTEPIMLDILDRIPAENSTISPKYSSMNIVHTGQAGMTFTYSGDCQPDGQAIRRSLTELNDQNIDQIIDHKITCAEIKELTDYTARINATVTDSAAYKGDLAFSTSSKSNASPVSVLNTVLTARESIDALFNTYLEEVLMDKLNPPGLVKPLVADIISELTQANWQHLGNPIATYRVISQQIAYQSRTPAGLTSADLTGLVAIPATDDGPFQQRNRVVVLTHATGSTPSDLDSTDAWYILANLIASQGYLVIAPDNWGRGGTSGQPETYLMNNRTSNNALDMILAILAADDYSEFHNQGLKTELTIIGYSQGGHSAIGLWQSIMTSSHNLNVKEVYAGGAPYNLYQTFKGVLAHLDNNCNEDAYCRFVDAETTVPYVVNRILPGLLGYLETGFSETDLVQGNSLSSELVVGFLRDDAEYDSLKSLLQLNSFTNIVDPIAANDTLVHLYHSPFDRLVPSENTAELTRLLEGTVNLVSHENQCNSTSYELLFNTIDKVGVGHTLCGLTVIDEALAGLQ